MGFESAPVDGSVPGIRGILIEFTAPGASLVARWPQRCSLKTLYEGDPETECATALVGRGEVTSEITVGDEDPVTVGGRLRAYVSEGGGSQKILAQVITGEPLPLVYVIPFAIERRKGGITRLTVSPRRMHHVLGKCVRTRPYCLGPNPYTLEGMYSHIARFEMSMHRVVGSHGARLSFVRGGCLAAAPPDVVDWMRFRVTFEGEPASEGGLGPECQDAAQRSASQASTVAASRSGGKTG